MNECFFIKNEGRVNCFQEREKCLEDIALFVKMKNVRDSSARVSVGGACISDIDMTSHVGSDALDELVKLFSYSNP